MSSYRIYRSAKGASARIGTNRWWCWWTLWFTLASLAFSAPGDQRLINISSRAQVGSGGNILIAGFVVGQGAPKRVLIRAVGPTLSNYGLSGLLADPQLTLFDSAGNALRSDDDWSASDAPSIADAGAFALPVGSKDAVIVTDLPSGAYTAQVSGKSASTGIALVEVYDVSGPARLMNISSRAWVGTGSGILISGVVVAPSSGPRKVLIRAAGPALAAYHVDGWLADPALAVINSAGAQIAANDNWESADTAGISSAVTQAGAFPFASGSKDAAVVLNLMPGAYTVQVSGANNSTGVALVEIYDLSPSVTGPTLGVVAATAVTSTTGSGPALFTFTRSGDLSAPLTVSYSLSGTATSDVDYSGLVGSVTFPAGVGQVNSTLTALNSTTQAVTKTATITLNPVSGYTVTTGPATATIYYGPSKLYVANLRAAGSAVSSTAYGVATITLSADGRYAFVSVTFSNLSSPETVAYLRLGDPTKDGVQIFRLPNGQVSSADWNIQDAGGYSAADIVAALQSGNFFLSVDSVNYPGGELRGTYLASSGVQTFVVPPTPPALSSGAPTPQDAARFLIQATFGPTKADIDALVARGFNGWIQDQLSAKQSMHRAATLDDFAAYPPGGTTPKVSSANRQAAWWKIAVTGPDQLRQRVAFALSELFVISDVDSNVGNWPEGAAYYYDILATDAFGNFRQLLEDVTLSPMMGMYLSHLRNRKATATTQPDENYAREVMQLFTIGLNQLQPDGTLKLDASGQPIPTYDQTTITEMAKVFTGWQLHNASPSTSNFYSGGSVIDDFVQPMTLNPNFHEPAAKTIFDGIVLPANQGGAADLKQTLDALVNHANTGPFVARRLIQRLVTSNPSPGYVYRVAQVFANNGTGVRGDLAAVVKAILLDYEARSPDVAANVSFGKAKEPLLRTTALLRALAGASDSGRYPFLYPEGAYGQAALRSPTVFNFFLPDYVQPGLLASAGLYAPEFQIITDTTAISIPNSLYSPIYATRAANTVGLDYKSLPAVAQAGAVVDQLNLVLCGGGMSTVVHDRIVSALTSLPTTATDTDRYRVAVYLVVSTQNAAVQK